jgi:hypothetical protein
MKGFNCFFIVFLLLGLTSSKSMISTNSLLKKTSFTVPVTKTRLQNLESGFCAGYIEEKFTLPCDHLEENVHWTIQPDGNGKYFFFCEGTKNYLTFQMQGAWKKASLGNKMAFNIEKKRDQNSFRISFKEGKVTFCLDTTNGGYFEECDGDDLDRLSFYYLFDQEPLSPLVEPEVFYSLGFIGGEKNVLGYTPQKNDIQSDQNPLSIPFSNWFAASLFRFHPHPTTQGIYQIINSDGFSLLISPRDNSYGVSYLAKTDEKNLFQWFRLVRCPFNPDRMYIILHAKPNYIIHQRNFVPHGRTRFIDQGYEFTVRKTCLDIPQVRENVWYQLRSDDDECVSNVPATNEIKFFKCNVKPEFFWKFNWDDKHKGFIITHKKTGKVLNFVEGSGYIVNLDNLRDNKAQRWAFLDRSPSQQTMIEIINRSNAACFNGSTTGGCGRAAFLRPVQALFKLAREGPFQSGYVGTCGVESGIAPKPPQPPVNPPQPPVNPPQPPVNSPQLPFNPPQPPSPNPRCRRRNI